MHAPLVGVLCAALILIPVAPALAQSPPPPASAAGAPAAPPPAAKSAAPAAPASSGKAGASPVSGGANGAANAAAKAPPANAKAPPANAKADPANAKAGEASLMNSDTPDAAAGEVDDRGALLPDAPYSGSYTTSIPIAVPGFRGLEPKLSLTYDSGRGLRAGGPIAGYLGTGWSLDGGLMIVRASPGRGTPRFDDNGDDKDIFLLDGEEIVACEGAKAPSCTSGGNYMSKVESYRRFSYSKTNKLWLVTARDGTAYTYKASGEIDATLPGSDDNLKERSLFLLVAAKDRRGNQVDYSWACASASVCYPRAITYNKTRIDFFREPLPKAAQMTLANGGDVPRRVTQRLKTIRVRTAGENVRAYRLAYDESAVTGSSRLEVVQEYGNDVTFDDTGTIKGGTPLPATTFKYSSSPITFKPPAALPPGGSYTEGSDVLLDLNGDQKIDSVSRICEPDPNAEPPSDPVCKFKPFVSGGFGGEPPAAAEIQGKYQNVLPITIERIITGDFRGNGTQQFMTVSTWDGCAPSGNDGCVEYKGARLTLYTLTNSGLTATIWKEFEDKTLVGKMVAGDFDGDGRTDVLVGGSLLPTTIDSNGQASPGLNVFGTYPPCQAMGGSYRIQAGDFNGDGKTDLLCIESDFVGTYVKILIWTGTAFEALESGKLTIGSNFEGSASILVADVNGDGKSDAVQVNGSDTYPPGRVRVLLSNGAGLINGPSLEIANAVKGAAVGDFDGDGRFDIYLPLVEDLPGGKILRLKGSTLTTTSWEPAVPFSGAARIGDFNGDGKTDFRAGGIYSSEGPPQDLLIQVKNVTGGLTKVTYEPSSVTQNTRLPFVLQRVKSIERDDGRGNITKTSFAYEGGLYDPEHRRFFGFKKVTMSLPCTAGEAQCPEREYLFRQDVASAGKIEKLTVRAGSAVLRTIDEEWKVKLTGPPYRALNIATNRTDRLEGVSRTRRVERQFDAFGNLTELQDHGRTGASGDERTTRWRFYPNATSAFVVNRPAVERVYRGLGPLDEAHEIARTLFYYDGATELDTPPKRGEVTWARRWTGAAGGYVERKAAYDGFGNPISVTDEIGRVTKTQYESTYNLFPTAVTVEAGGGAPITLHTASWNSFIRCGKPTTTTDLSGLATTYEYDQLCRPTAVNKPGGDYTTWSYEDWGNPDKQHVLTTMPRPGGGVISRSYGDGFGRVWRTHQPAPAGTAVVDTDYNPRGLVQSRSEPFFPDGSKYITNFQYDGLDRPVKVIRPDGTTVTSAYRASSVAESGAVGFDFVETTDELGREARTHRDAAGRPIRLDRPFQNGAVLTTRMGYDRLGRLIRVTDPAGNVFAYAYDGLGRRLKTVDPDRGTWRYAYNAAGELIGQTDARGETTAFAYDMLGRLTQKTVRQGAGAFEEVTTHAYDEARAGFVNGGRLTSLSNQHATIAYDYEASGRRVRDTYTTAPAGPGLPVETHVLRTEYDVGGYVTKRAWSLQGPAGGSPVASELAGFTYDTAGRLSAITGHIKAITYDASGRPTKTVYKNGALDGPVTTRSYSPQRGWLDTLSVSGTLSLAYKRDKAGRITAITSSDSPAEGFAFAYNDADWLTASTRASSERQTFAYDKAGNLLRRVGPPGPLAAGGNSFQEPIQTSQKRLASDFCA